MAQRTHKGQHFIPSSYLAAWRDPNTPTNHVPFVHLFEKDGKQSKKRAPDNIFKATDIYTIIEADGRRNLKLEHWLAKVEKSFVLCRRDFLDRRRDIPPERRVKLIVFTSMLHARTPAMRDHWGGFFTEIKDAGEEMIRAMQGKSDEEKQRFASAFPRSKGPTMSHEHVVQFAEKPMQSVLPIIVRAEVPLLVQMQLNILCTNDPVGFITSDTPVRWFSPTAYRRHPLYRSPAMMDADLEITLPLSPNQCLLLTHGDPVAPCRYVDVPKDVVDEINRRVRFECDKSFVVRRNITDPIWFDPGDEPADSWEKQNPEIVAEWERKKAEKSEAG